MNGYYYRINTKTWYLCEPINGYVQNGAESNKVIFKCNDGRIFWVSGKPNEVYSCGKFPCLWLLERDDAAAYKTFYKYYYKMVFTPKVRRLMRALNEIKINAFYEAHTNVEETS